MAFPQDALAPHETLVLDLHPHWWFIAKSGILLVLAILVGIVAAVGLEGTLGDVVHVLVAIWIIINVGWFLVRFIQWVSIHFVLTSDRVMYQSGVFAKRGIEIPLERINTVFFQQGIIERMLRLGDLEIESASKDGAQRFEDIRRPRDVQKEIYVQVNANQESKYDRLGQAATGAQQAVAAAPPSIADQVNQLAQLRDQGLLTEAEFQAKKTELLGRM
jgi:uncharacterized membrane protein YdbT with pleckstrin-like domain